MSERYRIPRMQSDLHREAYYRLLKWLMAALFIILFLIVLNVYMVIFPPTYKYMVSTTSGELYEWCVKEKRFVHLEYIANRRC